MASETTAIQTAQVALTSGHHDRWDFAFVEASFAPAHDQAIQGVFAPPAAMTPSAEWSAAYTSAHDTAYLSAYFELADVWYSHVDHTAGLLDSGEAFISIGAMKPPEWLIG